MIDEEYKLTKKQMGKVVGEVAMRLNLLEKHFNRPIVTTHNTMLRKVLSGKHKRLYHNLGDMFCNHPNYVDVILELTKR